TSSVACPLFELGDDAHRPGPGIRVHRRLGGGQQGHLRPCHHRLLRRCPLRSSTSFIVSASLIAPLLESATTSFKVSRFMVYTESGNLPSSISNSAEIGVPCASLALSPPCKVVVVLFIATANAAGLLSSARAVPPTALQKADRRHQQNGRNRARGLCLVLLRDMVPK